MLAACMLTTSCRLSSPRVVVIVPTTAAEARFDLLWFVTNIYRYTDTRRQSGVNVRFLSVHISL